MEVEIDQVHRFDDVLYDDSRLRLPDQLHQPRADLEPDVPALAAALADDPTNLAAALRGAQVSWASWSRSGTAKQRFEPPQTRASALAMAAAIISSVNWTSAMPLLTKSDAKRPDPDLRRHQPDQTPGERFLERAAIIRPLLRRAQGHHAAGMIDGAGVGPDLTLARPQPWLAGGRHSLIVALRRAGIGEDRCGLGPIADLGDKLPGVPPVLQLQP
jgi:hypothetical protein